MPFPSYQGSSYPPAGSPTYPSSGMSGTSSFLSQYETPPAPPPSAPLTPTPEWVSPKVAELLNSLGVGQDSRSTRRRSGTTPPPIDPYAATEQALLSPLPTYPYADPPARTPSAREAPPTPRTPPSSRSSSSRSSRTPPATPPASTSSGWPSFDEFAPPSPRPPIRQPQSRPQPEDEDTEAVLARLMALVAEIPTVGAPDPEPEPEPEPPPPRQTRTRPTQGRSGQGQVRQSGQGQVRQSAQTQVRQPTQGQTRQSAQTQERQSTQGQLRQTPQGQARQPRPQQQARTPAPPPVIVEPDIFDPTDPLEADSALARLLAYSPETDELIAPAPQPQRQPRPQQRQPQQRPSQQRPSQQPQPRPQQRQPQPVALPEPELLTIPELEPFDTPQPRLESPRVAPRPVAEPQVQPVPLSARAAATAAAQAVGAPGPMEARVVPTRAPLAPVAPVPVPSAPIPPAFPDLPMPAIFTPATRPEADTALPITEGTYAKPPNGRRSLNQQPDLTTFQRLRLGAPTDRLLGWAVTLVITVVAFVIRVINLHNPNKIMFDETYYAKDGWTIWKFGYERNWPPADQIDSTIISNPNAFLDTAEYVVHPPVGKWLIGAGEQLFGMNAFGWRFMPLIFGTLLVFVTIRLARRLSRSTLVGGIAGVLLTFDGLAFTMSRIALLDIFEAFFIVAAVSCCLADRDYYRAKLADRLEKLGIEDLNGNFGPVVWLRPWRLAAGLLFGLAIGTKWNAVFVLAVMGIVSVIWDVGARRLAGANYRSLLALLVDGVPAFLRLVVVGAAVYIATWSGWLLSADGYYRQWGAEHPGDNLTRFVGPVWASFLHYHQEILNFHTGEYIASQPHAYDAHPAGWLFMVRPLAVDVVNNIQPGVDGCPAGVGDTCIQEIVAIGTPVLWWFAAAALIVAVIWRIGARDWRFGLPLVAMLATYVPWFFTTERAQFFFYAITIIPFNVITLAMVLGLILGPSDAPTRRRGGIIVGIIVALVIGNFAWMYPVLTDQMLTHGQWLARMWLTSWI